MTYVLSAEIKGRELRLVRVRTLSRIRRKVINQIRKLITIYRTLLGELVRVDRDNIPAWTVKFLIRRVSSKPNTKVLYQRRTGS